MYANPGAILLLDEPDAHLEILRQRQTYQSITDAAVESGNQIIAASHSEVLLNEAAGKDLVIAFVGQPHRLADRGSQTAEVATGKSDSISTTKRSRPVWALYLEGFYRPRHSADLCPPRRPRRGLCAHLNALSLPM